MPLAILALNSCGPKKLQSELSVPYTISNGYVRPVRVDVMYDGHVTRVCGNGECASHTVPYRFLKVVYREDGVSVLFDTDNDGKADRNCLWGYPTVSEFFKSSHRRGFAVEE